MAGFGDRAQRLVNLGRVDSLWAVGRAGQAGGAVPGGVEADGGLDLAKLDLAHDPLRVEPERAARGALATLVAGEHVLAAELGDLLHELVVAG